MLLDGCAMVTWGLHSYGQCTVDASSRCANRRVVRDQKLKPSACSKLARVSDSTFVQIRGFVEH